jgi:iron complex outermembrane receptor protein
MKKRLTILVSLFLSATAMAQTTDEIEKSFEMDEIVVREYSLPPTIVGNRTVLDSALVQSDAASSIADILSRNSVVFIKSHGRASVATASFRGTGSSHTQVLWNGVKINSPMLGMTDFSMLPSHLTDALTLYHGAESMHLTEGGLGGAVVLENTLPSPDEKGFGLRYMQGVGSFATFDEFLHTSFAGDNFTLSLRAGVSSSANEFTYTNYMKPGKVRERNRNGDFRDIHLLPELGYRFKNRSTLTLSVWYHNSDRGVPMIFNDSSLEQNRQKEESVRSLLRWKLSKSTAAGSMINLDAKGGYIYSDLLYESLTSIAALAAGKTTPSYIHTLFADMGAEYESKHWSFAAQVSTYEHILRGADYGGGKNRFEFSGMLSAEWRPRNRLSLTALLRQNSYGQSIERPNPALFVDFIASHKGNVHLRASVAQGSRHPTLNDLYFVPGGNDSLRSEKGLFYDFGLDFRFGGLSMSASAYNSVVRDWILWLGNGSAGYFSPVNIKSVHSYGAELRANYRTGWGRHWRLSLDGCATYTRTLNMGEPLGEGDNSIGKQLPYIPLWSASFASRLEWREWSLAYHWNYYSRRYTTSDEGAGSRYGVVPPYFMNDLSVGWKLSTRRVDLSLGVGVNNLFGEEYVTVLGYPMPGRNYTLNIALTPKFKGSNLNKR